MKLANADKLKYHFEHVVMVKLFTVPEILTIIDTFTLDFREGDKFVFHTDEDGTQIVTNLSEKERLENMFGSEANDWIPIEYRPGTEEEYGDYSRFGNCPRDEFKVYTNTMPEDGEEVLITTRSGDVCEDIYHDDPECCYFEDHDDPDEVIAWMRKPKAYIGGTQP